MSQKLTGKIFEIGGDKKDCKVLGECDCCTSEIYFLNDLQFSLFDYCTFEHILLTGTYKVLSNTVTLTFKQTSVTNGADDEDGKPYLKKAKAEIKPVIFFFGKCDNGALMLENKEIKDYKFGLRKSEIGEAKRIADFLKTDEWRLILE
jgi:hypothetical protein